MYFAATVADPHPTARCGTQSLLEEMGARVITGIEEGSDFLKLFSVCEVDLLVTETGLPGFEALGLLRRARKRGLLGEETSTEALVLTGEKRDPWVSGAFQLGASGYVLKSDSAGELEAAIRAVSGGEKYLSSSLPRCLMERATPERSNPDSSNPGSKNGPISGNYPERSFDRLETLTEREQQVLRLTAEGLTSREIGKKLSISVRTAQKHRENVRTKLRVENAVEMVAYALRRGMARSPLQRNAHLRTTRS